MSDYQDKLMEEAKELEEQAKEQRKVQAMTYEQRSTYWISKSLELQGIYIAGRYDGD